MLKNMLENKKLFIFDMDGTLIESLGVWNEADKIFLKNVTGVLIGASIIGDERDNFLSTCKEDNPYIGWVNYIKTKYNIDEPLEDLVEYRQKICFDLIGLKLELKPYAKEVLTLLKENGYKLCLASSGAPTSIKRIFTEIDRTSFLGNGIFDLVLDSSSVKNLKPSPEIHERAISYFNIPKYEAVIIEDSKVGFDAANLSGIDAIIVKEPLNKDCEEIRKRAKYYIHSLEELYEIMLEITKKSPKLAKNTKNAL